MRRAQDQVLQSRAYSQKAWEVLDNVAEVVGANEHPLLAKRDTVRAVDIILISSDRSLCGAYNNNIIRTAERFAATLNLPNEAIRWIPVGRKEGIGLVDGDAKGTTVFCNVICRSRPFDCPSHGTSGVYAGEGGPFCGKCERRGRTWTLYALHDAEGEDYWATSAAPTEEEQYH